MENLSFFEKNQEIFADVCKYHLNYRYPEIDNVDEDAFLYERGFLNDYESEKCRFFIEAELEDKVKILSSLDEINKKLGQRILFRNYDVSLFEEIMEEKKQYFSKINPVDSESAPLDYMGNKRILPKDAVSKIDELLNSDPIESDRALLNDLRAHVYKNFDL